MLFCLYYLHTQLKLYRLGNSSLQQPQPPMQPITERVSPERIPPKHIHQHSNTLVPSNRPEDQQQFYNMITPAYKIQCDGCKRDITKTAKILAHQLDYCASCFAKIDTYPHIYYAISKLDFPLWEGHWSAQAELLLLESMERHGFGNWTEIASSTGQSQQEIERHYYHVYLQGQNFLPTNQVITRRDSKGRLEQIGENRKNHPYPKNIEETNKIQVQVLHETTEKGSQSTPSLAALIKVGSNPAEIVGFMPKRGEFEVQYDNDAQLLLAELQFNQDDSQMIDIYNEKLCERNRRKDFVLQRKLLDLKEQSRIEKDRPRPEKEVYNMMKIFARFSTPSDHERLVQGIIKEKQIRQRIEELEALKQRGFRNMTEAKTELAREGIQRREVGTEKNHRRKPKREVVIQKEQEKWSMLAEEEKLLCQRFGLEERQYLMIRETFIRQSVRQGAIPREEASGMLKLERNVVDGVLDFLMEKQLLC